ncbi:hypothetical protein QCE63_05615 [Caballeronia sp. LZ065]|uniref:hypothetical protein n=1 Tax=Caballeronia sp. LZ065 TaxID=3038571 RepID=UPI00285ADF01|nr:hypothetical protein [Caballeronia sp. LZ065]MDR5778905.1 hypothetical protein [Caballeronia sp. LZ065]
MTSISSDYSRSLQTQSGSNDMSEDPQPAAPSQGSGPAGMQPGSQDGSGSPAAEAEPGSQAAAASSGSRNSEDAQADGASQPALPSSEVQASQTARAASDEPVTGQNGGPARLGTTHRLALSQTSYGSDAAETPSASPTSRGSAAQDRSDASQAAPTGSSAEHDPFDGMSPRALARNLVMNSDAAEAGDRFTAALGGATKDIEGNQDTTDHMIEAAKAYNDFEQITGSTKPTDDQQDRENRLTYGLMHAKDTDTLDTIAKDSKVDLTPLNKDHSLAQYGKYGKTASGYIRSIIFDEGRFNRSEVLKGTPFSKFQRPGVSVLDPIGKGPRLGILAGTRANSAGSNFTSGFSSFQSGFQKLRDHEDPTDDFLKGGAAIGQGINDMTVGLGADVGRHLVVMRQLERAQASGPVNGSNGAGKSTNGGTPANKAGSGSQPDDQRSIVSMDREIDTRNDAMNAKFDEAVTARHTELEDQITNQVASSNRDAQPLALQDAVSERSGEYVAMQKLGVDLKQSGDEEARAAHANLRNIDAESQVQMRRLNDMGYDSAEAARNSGDRSALESLKRLDDLGKLKHEAYDQFNFAMANREALITKGLPALKELGEGLKAPTQEARQMKFAEWKNKYGEMFEKYQNSFLSHTDAYPDWFKISKPLRTEILPSGINTALGAVGFGASLDSYLKKQANGTLTTQDKLNLGGQTFTLLGGAVGLVPVVGPLFSIVFTTAGVVLNGLADGYQDWQNAEAQQALLNKMRDNWNREHPDQEIAEPFEGD